MPMEANRPERITIQGEEKTRPEVYRACKRLGELLKDKEWEVVTGAYGGLVQAISETGVKYHPHETGRKGEVRGTTTPEDCLAEVQQINPEYGIVHAWGMRLGHMIAEARAYAFFPGKEGTMAHLVPVLTFMRKRFTKEAEPRRVALLGWSEDQVRALETLNLIESEDFGDWIQTFNLTDGDIQKAVEFLTKKSPRS